MVAVKRYIANLEREDGAVENVKFCIPDRPGLEPDDIAKEAMNAVSMHRGGLAKAVSSFPEPDLDSIDLKPLLLPR